MRMHLDLSFDAETHTVLIKLLYAAWPSICQNFFQAVLIRPRTVRRLLATVHGNPLTPGGALAGVQGGFVRLPLPVVFGPRFVSLPLRWRERRLFGLLAHHAPGNSQRCWGSTRARDPSRNSGVPPSSNASATRSEHHQRFGLCMSSWSRNPKIPSRS